MIKKILVIDDDQLVIKSIKKYLSGYGYGVETAQSGIEALEKTKKSTFNLIISDIRMPGMDGIQTLKKIRESSVNYNKENIPAIVITGYAGGDEVYRKRGDLGIVECIYKPFELDEFIDLIRKTLELPPRHIQEAPVEYGLLDNEFISLAKELKQFLQEVKDRFDEFDKLNNDKQKQIDFIEAGKKGIFSKLDNYFDKTWEIVKDFERDKYIAHQNHFQQILGYLLLELIETNRHVYRKPFGYAGDYVMINYIYDYGSNNNYLGNSSYEKLLNNYTCNIPISRSNTQRKEFLKEKILEALQKKDKAKILSVACGPARELIELLRERKINKPLWFKCLDFEKKVLDYIDKEIKKIEPEKRQMLSVEYICRDIASIIRDKNLKRELGNCDLVYVFGLFDYLSDRMAARLTKELYQLLQKEGKLITCNINAENSSRRAYYELLGGWNMVHRTKDEMLSWLRDIKDAKEVKFESYLQSDNYLYLNITKS